MDFRVYSYDIHWFRENGIFNKEHQLVLFHKYKQNRMFVSNKKIISRKEGDASNFH